MPDFSRCAFSEGYGDRSLNVPLAGDDVTPSINTSRAALQPAA
ncbi:Uncharacterised protein [Serratia ficaria]|nr:Uncharacterised protein [Serratia ficaria]